MRIFDHCHFVLELDFTVSFKEKTLLKKKIIDNGGIISFLITAQTKFMLMNNAEKAQDSYKAQTALKKGIPIVGIGYLDACIEAQKLLDPDKYLISGNTAASSFGAGKILASGVDKQLTIKKLGKPKQASVNVNQLPVFAWTAEEKKGKEPNFNEAAFDIGKYALLEKTEYKTKVRNFACVELQVSTDVSGDVTSQFRVFTHTGTLSSAQGAGVREVRYLESVGEAEYVYGHFVKQFSTSGYSQKQFISLQIGSDMLRQHLIDSCVQASAGLRAEWGSSGIGGAEIKEFVEGIWREALAPLGHGGEGLLSVPVRSVGLDQVTRAEAVLRLIRDKIQRKERDTEGLSSEFYTLVPFKKAARDPINNLKQVSLKQDFCQLIRDVVSIGESTKWDDKLNYWAKYATLGCSIEKLALKSDEFNLVKEIVLSAASDASVIGIRNIYRIDRPSEHISTSDESNKKLLFHSSSYQNMLGILSRGLLLPKVIVSHYGGERSDYGKLGAGIYFASNTNHSVKFSSAGESTRTRLLLLHEVHLGRCWDSLEEERELERAPEGYDSVKGVGRSEEKGSKFSENEFVVYSTKQQKLKFAVEFQLPSDGVIGKTADTESEDGEEQAGAGSEGSESSHVEIGDVQGISNPMDKVVPGLQVVGGDASGVPLKSVHIRVKLMDLSSEVIVMQEYENESLRAIEAKYVFPLNENACVCGFEAFINGKHIVGEVKEKEKAHREYREAIKEGHGAYLMDEEVPDVFTVSVGNLPPGANVLIKITYVSELEMEGDSVLFNLPGSVAPWQTGTALDPLTQSEVGIVKIKDQHAGKTSLQLKIEMPFDIQAINCSSHSLKIKKTQTKAVLEMFKGQSLGKDGFHLQVVLSHAHVPRMWVEQAEDGTETCMLTFYPEFEVDESPFAEILFLLDCSHSMHEGDTFSSAKKVLLLALHHLPNNCRFNIIKFGSGWEELFPYSQNLTKDSLKQASNWVQQVTANMGSTNLWKLFQAVELLYKGSSSGSLIPNRSMFLISDGHVTQEHTVLNKIQDISRHSRVFTLGVGAALNKHLMNRMSRTGLGCSESFDTSAKSKWEGKVNRQINRAFQPALGGIEVEWKQYDDGSYKPEAPVWAPLQLGPVFHGNRLVVYGFAAHCRQAVLRASLGGKQLETSVFCSDLSVTKGVTLGRLTAKAVIRDSLEGHLEGDPIQDELKRRERKPKVIEMSKKYCIVTQYTSFVAVEKREKGEVFGKEKGPSIEELVTAEDVDILSYMGWEYEAEEEHVSSGELMLQEAYNEAKSSNSIASLERALDIAKEQVDPSNPKRLELSLLTVQALIQQQHYSQAVNLIQQTDSSLAALSHAQLSTEADKTLKELNYLLATIEYTHGQYDETKTDEDKQSVARGYKLPTDVEIAKKLFDDRISELDCMSEDSYKDETLKLQLLRDFIDRGEEKKMLETEMRARARERDSARDRDRDRERDRDIEVNLLKESEEEVPKRTRICRRINRKLFLTASSLQQKDEPESTFENLNVKTKLSSDDLNLKIESQDVFSGRKVIDPAPVPQVEEKVHKKAPKSIFDVRSGGGMFSAMSHATPIPPQSVVPLSAGASFGDTKGISEPAQLVQPELAAMDNLFQSAPPTQQQPPQSVVIPMHAHMPSSATVSSKLFRPSPPPQPILPGLASSSPSTSALAHHGGSKVRKPESTSIRKGAALVKSSRSPDPVEQHSIRSPTNSAQSQDISMERGRSEDKFDQQRPSSGGGLDFMKIGNKAETTPVPIKSMEERSIEPQSGYAGASFGAMNSIPVGMSIASTRRTKFIPAPSAPPPPQARSGGGMMSVIMGEKNETKAETTPPVSIKSMEEKSPEPQSGYAGASFGAMDSISKPDQPQLAAMDNLFKSAPPMQQYLSQSLGMPMASSGRGAVGRLITAPSALTPPQATLFASFLSKNYSGLGLGPQKDTPNYVIEPKSSAAATTVMSARKSDSVGLDSLQSRMSSAMFSMDRGRSVDSFGMGKSQQQQQQQQQQTRSFGGEILAIMGENAKGEEIETKTETIPPVPIKSMEERSFESQSGYACASFGAMDSISEPDQPQLAAMDKSVVMPMSFSGRSDSVELDSLRSRISSAMFSMKPNRGRSVDLFGMGKSQQQQPRSGGGILAFMEEDAKGEEIETKTETIPPVAIKSMEEISAEIFSRQSPEGSWEISDLSVIRQFLQLSLEQIRTEIEESGVKSLGLSVYTQLLHFIPTLLLLLFLHTAYPHSFEMSPYFISWTLIPSKWKPPGDKALSFLRTFNKHNTSLSSRLDLATSWMQYAEKRINIKPNV